MESNNISEEILNRCRTGDKEAFRVVVQQYQRMLFCLAARLLCNEDDAKDVVQETFIKVWLNLSHYDDRQNFRTWIYTIATRLCIDRLRQRSWEAPMPDEEEYFAQYVAEDKTDLPLENHQLLSILHTLVAKLSNKQRIVFTLIYLENLSTEEVTRLTGLDAAKIKSNLYVARRTIQEQLKRLGYE
jgi:RNA polymerase sigma-70 factor (ECF subfamily)